MERSSTSFLFGDMVEVEPLIAGIMFGFQIKDNWLITSGPLTALEASFTMADLVDVHGTWCLERVRHIILDEICDCILSLHPPNLNGSMG